jgi:signal transduction histidine kinase
MNEFDEFYNKHPEFLHTKYLLNFSKAVMEMYIGHPAQFHTIIEQTEQELKEKKLFKEFFRLNLKVCHFLSAINQDKEAKRHFYENEKLLSDLEIAGLKNFDAYESTQFANSFGMLFKNEEQLDSAEKYFRLGLYRAKRDSNRIWIGIISGNLGSILASKGDFAMAEKLLIIDKNESILSNQITSAINAILALIDIKLSQNNVKEAEIYLNQADSLINAYSTKNEQENSIYNIERTSKLGALQLLKGNKMEALENMQKAYLALKSRYKNKLFSTSNLNSKRFAFEENVSKISELEDKSNKRKYIIFFIIIIVLWLIITLINQRRFNQRLKEKNSQIEEQAKVLQELNAQKSKLFSVVAHDMRSPFANLRNLIDMHADKALTDEEFMLFCKDINKSIHGLSGTFENIMSWAKVGMEHGIKVNVESLNFASIFSDIILQINPISEVKSISIQHIETTTKEFFADKNLILVVLRNLIHNAIKFSHVGSQISILFSDNSENNKEVLIQIVDKGIGMNEEMLQNLNNSNSKQSLNGTEGEKGSGLGLMICNEFIVAMNGSLKIESKLGEGSIFSIFLPISKQ